MRAFWQHRDGKGWLAVASLVMVAILVLNTRTEVDGTDERTADRLRVATDEPEPTASVPVQVSSEPSPPAPTSARHTDPSACGQPDDPVAEIICLDRILDWAQRDGAHDAEFDIVFQLGTLIPSSPLASKVLYRAYTLYVRRYEEKPTDHAHRMIKLTASFLSDCQALADSRVYLGQDMAERLSLVAPAGRQDAAVLSATFEDVDALVLDVAAAVAAQFASTLRRLEDAPNERAIILGVRDEVIGMRTHQAILVAEAHRAAGQGALADRLEDNLRAWHEQVGYDPSPPERGRQAEPLSPPPASR